MFAFGSTTISRVLVWAKKSCPWAKNDQQLRGICLKKWIWVEKILPMGKKWLPK
jgi:hypothetical protein